MKISDSFTTRSTIFLILLCAAFAVAASAQTFTSLTDLGSQEMNPSFNGLIQGTDGNFYGVARDGGTVNRGSVYKVTPGGTVSVVYTFCALANCADGIEPQSSLLLAADGNFYGTTGSGGATNFGTVFKLTPGGVLTTLYSFCPAAGCHDGTHPSGALVQGYDGNIYGTAETLFRITPGGVFTLMHTFCTLANCADGNDPSGLVLARDGSMYGVTLAGGTQGEGVVYRFTPAGQFKILYSFCALTDCADGEVPMGSLVVTATGTVYGTTEGGGVGNNGTVFQLTQAGTLTTLYKFCTVEPCPDGWGPVSGLIQATDGRLYGTTAEGGFNDRGTVFRITTAGAFTRLHSFDSNDGAYPVSPPLQGTDGNVYGNTSNGGPRNRTVCTEGVPYGCGTVFRESGGIKPFVKSVQRGAHVGDSITILGNSLTSTTGVTFNGTAATFSVVSDTEITATVPTGATDGLIQVVTSGSTLASNVAFHVLP